MKRTHNVPAPEPDEDEKDDRYFTPDFGQTDRERQGLKEHDPDRPSHRKYPKIPEYDNLSGRKGPTRS